MKGAQTIQIPTSRGPRLPFEDWACGPPPGGALARRDLRASLLLPLSGKGMGGQGTGNTVSVPLLGKALSLSL